MKSMTLPKSLTTVTSLSKTLALLLFIALPIIGFYLGIHYQKALNDEALFMPTPTSPIQTNPSPTCRPRPACLDATPRCMMPETSDMCPKTSPTQTTVICTQDAKLCADGSYVSRTGPKCEFTACPNK